MESRTIDTEVTGIAPLFPGIETLSLVAQTQNTPTVLRARSEDPDDVVIPRHLPMAVVGYWKGSFGKQFLILRSGPTHAGLFSLEARLHIADGTLDLRQKSQGYVGGKTKKLISLRAVVWNFSCHDANRFTLLYPKVGKRGPTMACLVKWQDHAGKYSVSWETRSTVRRCYPADAVPLDDEDYTFDGEVILARGTQMAEADKAILVCAIKSEQRYLEWTRASRPAANRPSTQEPRKCRDRMTQLPFELQASIIGNLDPVDTLQYIKTHRNAGAYIDRCQRENISLWRSIFRNDTWINKVWAEGLCPVLIGHDILSLVGTSHSSKGTDSERPYIALVLPRSGLRFAATDKVKHPESFLASLRPHSFSLENMEIQFDRFTLNISNVFEPGSSHGVPNSRQLYTGSKGNTSTTALYWIDTTARRSIRATVAHKEVLIIDLPDLDQSRWAFGSRTFGPFSLEIPERRRLGGPIAEF